MTVHELIVELQALEQEGHGMLAVERQGEYTDSYHSIDELILRDHDYDACDLADTTPALVELY